MNDVTSDRAIDLISSVAGTSLTDRAKRVHGLRSLESLSSAAASPEESMIIDDRCDLSPAQMVETKLTRVLGGSTLPVSHLQMRGILRKR